MWSRVLKRFVRQPISMIGLGIVLAILALAFLAPLVSPFDPREQHWGHEYEGLSAKFLLGTDGLGRDVLSQLIWGAQTSLMVAVFGVVVAGLIGALLGALSGFFSGKLDNAIMMLTDTVLTLPVFFFLIVVASVLSVRSLPVMAVVIGVIDWPMMARVVRSQVLTLRERVYIEAARAQGVRNVVILFRHVMPNTIAPITVVSTLSMARYILYEAALAFIGLSDPEAISWGSLLAQGRSVMNTAWWLTIFPGVMIFITVLGFNLGGDGLRDAFDIRLEERG
jgi:peptide/nickel transport system permease protein